MEIFSDIIATCEVVADDEDKIADRNNQRQSKRWPIVSFDDPHLGPMLSGTAKSFRAFCIEVRGLRRLTNRMKTPLSSEGYNYLLEEQISKVTRSFADYIKHREELLLYIKTTFWRSRSYGCFQTANVSGENEFKAVARWIANAS
jgi:hypothetical protein